MTHDNDTPGPEVKAGPTTAAGAEAAAEQAAAPAGDVAVGDAQLKDIIGVLQGEIDKQKDQILRLLADMDNLRRRSEREKEETAKFAITKFARDVVGVADNFERAVAAVPPGAADHDATFATLLEGVSMTEREFINVLERHGVKRINPQGEAFNPHRHQAMMEVEDASVPPGTIMQVFQSGYVIEDRVIRPAMVVVAKGGQRAPKAAASDGNGGTNGGPQNGSNGTSSG